MFKQLWIVCVCLCLSVGTLLAQGEDRALVETARKTLQTYDKAIISLNAVLKFEAKGAEGVAISGLDQEHKSQCAATVIDPSGLAVTSLTNLNPQRAMGKGGKIKINRGGTTMTLELDCQIQEVKYRLIDGTDVPARVVLKDEDLDLAFLAPQKPLDAATQAKIAAISLSDAAPSAAMLDSTFVISRTDESMNYIPTLNVGRIVAIVAKPRSCYMTSQGTLGGPVFDEHGKILGLVCRCVRPEDEEGNAKANVGPLILPAADVAKLIPQAKKEAEKADAEEKKEKKADDAKKTEEKKADEKKSEK